MGESCCSHPGRGPSGEGRSGEGRLGESEPGHSHPGVPPHAHACGDAEQPPSARAAAPAGESGCGCHGGVPVFDGMDRRYKRVLWLVIAINGAMFLVEMAAGALGRSQSLKADALDFLGDTLTYGLSLAVIGAAVRVRAAAAMLKGLSLTVMAVFVLSTTLYQVFVLGLPRAEVMGAVGILALAANGASVLMLARYKDGDANVRSVWLCSRNDAIGNVLVMAAGVGVWATGTAWPDLLVAFAMAGLFLRSSTQILSQALAEMRASPLPHPAE